jgi:flagellar hook-associated protein 3 FlgL
MRVTNRMSFDQAQAQMMAARDRAMKAQQQVTSGMRVDHPGDDPAAAGVMVSQGIAIQRLDTIDKTTSSAQGEVQTADGALQNVSTLLSRAQQLAVQLGNDTYSAAERSAGAQEINSISSQIVQLMNTQVAGRYIFGGTKDSAPPFDLTGNYQGDTNVRQIEIAPGLLQASSIRADVALKGTGGGVDVFGALAAVSAALANNDGATVRGAIGGLDKSTDQLSAALTSTGGILSAFESAQQIGSVAKDSAQKVLAAQSESDIFEATSNLSLAQQSLQASLAVTAQSFGVTLLNYLK